MVPEDKGIVKTSTLEDAQTNLKFEDGDPKPVSTFSKLVFMSHIMHHHHHHHHHRYYFHLKGSFLQI
jgi:hypothetical protein